MKKQLRIALFLPPEIISPITRTLALAFGRENVVGSVNTSELFPILSQLRPTTLILDPKLFIDDNVSVDDIITLKNRFRCHILIVHNQEESEEIHKFVQKMSPEKEYNCPINYLCLVEDLPHLSKKKYTKVKEPLQKETRKLMDEIFQTCGFHCKTKGASYLKEALFMLYFQPELHRYGGAKIIYDTLAEKYSQSSRIVERSILRTIEFSLSAEGENLLRQTLNIPEAHDFFPISFQSFTRTFIQYFSEKYGTAQKLLRRR